MKALAALAVLLAAPPAFAQRNEVALLGGYTTAGDIQMKAAGLQTLEYEGSFTWGVSAGRFFTDHVGLEASWTQQRSGIVIGTRDGTADLFDTQLGVLQGSFVYQLGAQEARVKPFLLAGLGATRLSATDLEAETKFSWALGVGVKWFPARHLGARAQTRYAPTQLHDSSSEVCDPFGFCQGSLHQFEFMGGLVFRF
jgi:opacity protein-like surface antigen